MAEREGFEPPIGLHLCRISSAVHSTTLPPLRAPRQVIYPRSGRERVSIELQGAPIDSLIMELESQTGYHFYYDPAQFDSLRVSVSVTNVSLQKYWNWYLPIQNIILPYLKTRLMFCSPKELP